MVCSNNVHRSDGCRHRPNTESIPRLSYYRQDLLHPRPRHVRCLQHSDGHSLCAQPAEVVALPLAPCLGSVFRSVLGLGRSHPQWCSNLRRPELLPLAGLSIASFILDVLWDRTTCGNLPVLCTLPRSSTGHLERSTSLDISDIPSTRGWDAR